MDVNVTPSLWIDEGQADTEDSTWEPASSDATSRWSGSTLLYSVLDFPENYSSLTGSNASVSVGGNVTQLIARGTLSNEVLQQIAVMAFFMTIALVGNTTVLAYLCKTQGGKRPVTIFVMSLAISKKIFTSQFLIIDKSVSHFTCKNN